MMRMDSLWLLVNFAQKKGGCFVVIKEISENQPVSGRFLIVENQFRTAKNGSHFLAMKIADRTGKVSVKVWNADEELYTLLEVGKIMELTAVISKLFKDEIQLEWDGRESRSFRMLADGESDYAEFLPNTPGDIKGYWESLTGVVESIENRILRALLQEFFGDSTFVANFLRVPAALKRHHAYIGGLAEHTAGVTALAAAAATYYPLVDRDLLLTGAILHDIGKVQTYRIDHGFQGTDEGKLLGHLVLGVQMVDRALDRVCSQDAPDRELRNKLLHLLISHHGLMEWGSPIEPLTVEACILHHVDNLDAQTTKFLGIIREHHSNGEWAPFDTGLGRTVYLGKDLNPAEQEGNDVEGA